MAAKYISLIKEMYTAHGTEFAEFDQIHTEYEKDQKKWQGRFNLYGNKIVETMRFYERQLCGKSERSGMGVYSSKLAEKYWLEIKKRYPMIDFVGARIS